MKLGWYFHRLRAMSVSELAHRVTERWKHRSDAAFAESVRGIALGEAVEGVIALPVREAAPEVLRQSLSREAAALLNGDWKLFGWREVNVGAPPRWHQDATCGMNAEPEVLAHRLDHRALPNGADVRTIWEINRWSEMVRLAMHGWVNSDADSVRVAIGWLEDWCDKNPVGYGINWTSPLEAGLRLVNFVWFDALVRERAGCAPVEDGLLARLDSVARRIVPAHAAWVWRYRSFGSSANNHLMGELVGLLHAVKCWPTLKKSICSTEKLWQEISRCVLEQFAEDGGNKEQALHYHLFAWEMAWHAARLMQVTDGPVMERLQKAAEFLVHMAHDGEQWEYGDNDDAQIVPLTLTREHAVAEWRAWLRGDAAGCGLAYWLGPWSRREVPAGTWWVAPQSGMAVADAEGWKLRLDASPLGYGQLAAHGHGDALHLSLWDGPHALLIDPGTGGYFGAKELRSELAAWTSHNGPQPEAGYATPRRAGTFLWMGRHEQPQIHHDGAWLRAQFSHEGHAFTRRIVVAQDAPLEVHDEHRGPGRMRVRWFFAPECAVTLAAADAVSLRRGTLQWRVQFHSDGNPCELTLHQGIASRAYGKTEPVAVLEVAASGAICSKWHREHAART
ncbi:MAG: alginate lyase family protein [Roseimicrobium sp.]